MSALTGSLRLSEVFESLQGEGPSVGQPALFVRLAFCNLHCSYCDTTYSWDFTRHRREDEVHEASIAALRARINGSSSRRLVLTGGEPLLQQSALCVLLPELDRDITIEVETNGTRAPRAALLGRVNQWNVSPKLSSAGDPEALRIRWPVLRRFAQLEHAYLKLVVTDRTGVDEAERLVCALDWPRARVLLMPEARSRAELELRAPSVEREARALGLGFSSRLHLTLWDGARGR